MLVRVSPVVLETRTEIAITLSLTSGNYIYEQKYPIIIGSDALPLNKLPHPSSKTKVFCPTSLLTLTVFICLFPLGIQVTRDNSLYQGC